MKYCSIDVQTCGPNFKHHSILEFGAVLDDLDNQLPIEKLPRFHCYFKPPNEKGYSGVPESLLYHADKFKAIVNCECARNVHTHEFAYMFKEFLVDNGYVSGRYNDSRVTINAAGKNVSGFDLPFLNEQTNFSNYIKVRKRVIDPTLFFYRKGDEKLPNLNLCKIRSGMFDDVKDVHNSLQDALDIVMLVRNCLGAS